MNYQRAGAALVGVPSPPAKGKTPLWEDEGDGLEGQDRHGGHQRFIVTVLALATSASSLRRAACSVCEHEFQISPPNPARRL